MRKRIEKKQGKYFTHDEQHSIIQKMISNGLTKREIWEKYTGQKKEHDKLLCWMKKWGILLLRRLQVCLNTVCKVRVLCL